jgi:hypothetical protein
LETSCRAASEAIFGSSARGDTDRLSDRDILIVDEDLNVLRVRATILKAGGWSVASYTFKKLEALAARGALFVQHLKLESDILVDRSARLASLLAAYQPKRCYAEELSANARLANLVSTISEGSLSEMWAADVLYVTVRNFGVLKLAGNGIHVYSFDGILGALIDTDVLSNSSAQQLRKLRFMKCLYRSGEAVAQGKVLRTVRTALAGLPGEFFPEGVELVAGKDVLLSSPPPVGAAAYLVLRDLEKRLIAAQVQNRGPVPDPELQALQRWVADPRVYANLSAAMAPALRAQLERYVSGNIALTNRPAKFAAGTP